MASMNEKRPNPNQRGFETVSGISPDTKRLPYRITTTDVEKYLSKRVQGIKSKVDPNGDPIEVSVYSTEASKLFVPFIVLLSMNAGESQEDRKVSHGDPFFTTDRAGGNSVHLKKYIFELFQTYTYKKNDVRAFDSDDWRRSRGVSRQTSATLKNLATPKIMKNRNGEVLGIYFLLDPIAVFWDMLRIPGDNRQFQITIDAWQKQDASNFNYTVWRSIRSNKNKGYGKNIADELNYRMRSGNRR